MSRLLVGLGNDWRGDDAAGLEVARAVRSVAGEGLRVVEFGGEPAGLIELWRDEPDVLLVDAVRSGASPGTVHRLDPRSTPLPPELFRGSTHHLGVAEAVELARALDRLPGKLELVGIEGAEFAAGAALSAPVRAAVDRVARELSRAAA